MEYHGKLYGKIGNKYFDTGKTSADFDNPQTQIEKLEADKAELLEALERCESRIIPTENHSSLLRDLSELIQKMKQ